MQDSEEAFMDTTGLKDADKPHQEYKRRIVGKHTPRDIPTSARDLAQYGDTDVESDAPKRRKVGKQRMQELPSSSSDVAQYAEVRMEIDMILESDTGRYAWDDVDNMEIPLGAVQEARKEEMTHTKETTFKVVKRTEAFEKTEKPPISTKWVDTDKSHGVGKMNVTSRWVARDFKTRRKRP